MSTKEPQESSVPEAPAQEGGAPKHTQILTRVERSRMSGEVFLGVDLCGVDLSHADLRRARFVDATLRDCDFSGANLRGAEFIRCDLQRSNFWGAHLGGNRFDHSDLTGASGLSHFKRRYIVAKGGSLD